jgi:hypothetical protein
VHLLLQRLRGAAAALHAVLHLGRRLLHLLPLGQQRLDAPLQLLALLLGVTGVLAQRRHLSVAELDLQARVFFKGDQRRRWLRRLLLLAHNRRLLLLLLLLAGRIRAPSRLLLLRRGGSGGF